MTALAGRRAIFYVLDLTDAKVVEATGSDDDAKDIAGLRAALGGNTHAVAQALYFVQPEHDESDLGAAAEALAARRSNLLHTVAMFDEELAEIVQQAVLDEVRRRLATRAEARGACWGKGRVRRVARRQRRSDEDPEQSK